MLDSLVYWAVHAPTWQLWIVMAINLAILTRLIVGRKIRRKVIWELHPKRKAHWLHTLFVR